MKVTWLTQNGLLFENSKLKIMVDPYLTDSLGDIKPEKKRRIPADEKYFDTNPDVVLITHEHIDHFDMKTLEKISERADKSIIFFACESAYNKLLAIVLCNKRIHKAFLRKNNCLSNP